MTTSLLFQQYHDIAEILKENSFYINHDLIPSGRADPTSQASWATPCRYGTVVVGWP
jgi:hypothetical protein